MTFDSLKERLRAILSTAALDEAGNYVISNEDVPFVSGLFRVGFDVSVWYHNSAFTRQWPYYPDMHISREDIITTLGKTIDKNLL